MSLLYVLATAFANRESSRVKPHSSGNDCHALVKKFFSNTYKFRIGIDNAMYNADVGMKRFRICLVA